MKDLLNSCDVNDRLTILLNIKQLTQSTTYSFSNLPAWYEMLGIFSLYCIIAMSVFYAGLWIASRYMSPY